jgi:hypothetical protein
MIFETNGLDAGKLKILGTQQMVYLNERYFVQSFTQKSEEDSFPLEKT